MWHPEARNWGPGEVARREPVTYEQANTLRDALAAAVALEGFHRQCNVLTLANLAQIVNVLQSVVMTEGAAHLVDPDLSCPAAACAPHRCDGTGGAHGRTAPACPTARLP